MREELKADLAKLILRITIGGLMLFHGIHKVIHGHDNIANMLKSFGIPEFIKYGVPVGEVLAPILLVLGFFTIPSALLIAFTMLISIALAHGGKIFTLNPMHGGFSIELNLLYLVGALAIALLGAGKFSLGRGKLK